MFWDKSILGTAALYNIIPDLGLSVPDPITGKVSLTRFSWATSSFYLGFLVGTYPNALLAQKFRISRFLSVATVLWGITVMAAAACKSWEGLIIQRVFLGVIESAISPSFMLLTSKFYKQSEQPVRSSWWYSGNGWFTAIAPIANFGLGKINGGDWRYMYIVMGAVTIVWGFVLLLLPSSPITAPFLTPRERIVAIERLRAGQQGIECKTLKAYQIWEGLRDVKLYVFAISMGATYVINGGLTSGFGPLLVSEFGYSNLQSSLLQIPLGAVVVIAILGSGYLASAIPNIRTYLLMASCLPVIAGCIMIWKSNWATSRAVPIVGYVLLGFFGATASLIISLAVGNVAGNSKKSLVNSAVFVLYTVGNTVSPLLVDATTVNQHYPKAFLGIIICYCLIFVLAAFIRVYMAYLNRLRDRMDYTDRIESEKMAFKDETDGRNMYFRYVL